MKRHRFGITVVTVASAAALVGAGAALTGSTPAWLAALNERGEGLNREYGLGDHARQSARSSSAPDWLVALNARSDALNKQYGLGEYARNTARAKGKR